MKSFLYITVFLFLFIGSVSAERKTLDVIQRQIGTGITELTVPNPDGTGGVKFIEKKHEVRFDSTAGLYIYTYWRHNGEKAEILYEPSDRVEITVACAVSYDADTEDYTYRYKVRNSNSSLQSLSRFAISMDPMLVIRTEIPDSWHYFSDKHRRPEAPQWAFFGSLTGDIPPGGELSVVIISKYGPVLTTCYAQGSAREFVREDEVGPAHVGPHLEGVKGRTLAPGQVTIPGDDINGYLRMVMEEALEWGWLDSTTYQQTLQKIPPSQGLGRDGVASLMRDFRTVKPGVREPEVGALLDHLGKHLFGLTPEPVVPKGPPRR